MQLKTWGTEEGLHYQTFEDSIRHNPDHQNGEPITATKGAEFSIRQLMDSRTDSADSLKHLLCCSGFAVDDYNGA